MELRSLDYKFGGQNVEDTKKERNGLNKEIDDTREVRVTTLNTVHLMNHDIHKSNKQGIVTSIPRQTIFFFFSFSS